MDGADFDPELALRVLVEHEVRFVVIGGLAARALGAPLITNDTDVCYERSHENLERLAAALRALNARLRGAPADVPFQLDAETLGHGDHFTFTTDAGAFDILGTPSGSQGYASLEATAVPAEIEGVQVLIAGLEDLVRMKRAAGRLKDLRALEELGGLRDELEGRPEEPWVPPGERGE
jgi:hypothetical protein